MKKLLVFLLLIFSSYSSNFQNKVLDNSKKLDELHTFELNGKSYQINLPKGYKGKKEEYKGVNYYVIEYKKMKLSFSEYTQEEIERIGLYGDDEKFYKFYIEELGKIKESVPKVKSNLYKFESDNYLARASSFNGSYLGFKFITHFVDLTHKKDFKNLVCLVSYKKEKDEVLFENIISTFDRLD